MYFYCTFLHRGDKIRVKSLSESLFNYKSYIKQKESKDLGNLMTKLESGITKDKILGAISSYMHYYGLQESSVSLTGRPPSLLKTSLRRALLSNNFPLARFLVRQQRAKLITTQNGQLKSKETRVPFQKKLRTLLLIRQLELGYLLRKKKPLSEVVAFISSKLKVFKEHKFDGQFEMRLKETGNWQKVSLKVGLKP